MVSSMYYLKNIAITILIFVTIFSIIGLQLFNGPYMHATCRLTPFPVFKNYTFHVDNNPIDFQCLKNVSNFNIQNDEPSWTKSTSAWSQKQPNCYWPIDESDTNYCALTSKGKYSCGNGYDSLLNESEWRWCGSNYDALGNPRFNEKTAYFENYIDEWDYGSNKTNGISLLRVSAFYPYCDPKSNYGIYAGNHKGKFIVAVKNSPASLKFGWCEEFDTIEEMYSEWMIFGKFDETIDNIYK
jgi:hypothetical protein